MRTHFTHTHNILTGFGLENYPELGFYKAACISISSQPEQNHHILQWTDRRQKRKMEIKSD